MGDAVTELLESIYYNPKAEGSFGGLKKLYNAALKKDPSLKLRQVENWLNKQNAYTLFKQRRKNFLRVPILVDYLDEQWQADILDMTWLARENDGYKYILVVIDILSRYAWAIALKDKSAKTVTDAFNKIFSNGRKPDKLQTDQGKEFVNSTLKTFLTTNNVKHFTTTDDVIKCAIAERFNRTLRSRIYRYLSAENTNRYIDKLSDIIIGYNNSFHRTINTTPASVTPENETEILLNIRKSHKKINSIRVKPFKVGDFVRITRAKGIFEKGATTNWSEEVFKIIKVKKTPQGYIYRLEDLDSEAITSIFYHWELQLTEKPEVYKIEKILRQRLNPRTKRKEYLVKWLGYPAKFNSWVENVERI